MWGNMYVAEELLQLNENKIFLEFQWMHLCLCVLDEEFKVYRYAIFVLFFYNLLRKLI